MANSSWLSNRDPVIHGVRHQSPPRIWQDGFPLGNGFLGAMLWGDGDPLNLTLDCADLWDSRTDDSYWKGNPAYTYAHLRELIAAERYDEAEIIFGTPSNAITPPKISFGRMAICTGPATAYDCRLDLDRDWLARTGYPIVSEVFNFFRAKPAGKALFTTGCIGRSK